MSLLPNSLTSFDSSPPSLRSAELTRDASLTTPLDVLRGCVGMASLRETLAELCSAYGVLSRLEVLPAGQPGHQQALCFLRMQTPAEEQGLMQALGIGRFGGDLVLVVDLADELCPAVPRASHH